MEKISFFAENLYIVDKENVELSERERLDVSCVTFHNLRMPPWCNDVSLKLIHLEIPPCGILTGHTTAHAGLGENSVERKIESK